LVWPLWRGDPVPEGWPGSRRFARNLVVLLFPKTFTSLPPAWQWIQFLPLIAFQGLAIAGLVTSLGSSKSFEVKGVQKPQEPDGTH